MSLENSQLKNLEVSSDSSTENGANDHNSNSLVKTEAVNTTSQPLEEEQNDNPEVETKENSQKSTESQPKKGQKNSKNWKFILNKSKLSAHKKHVFKKFIIKRNKENYLKINIYPDGGISRIRAFGSFK
mgnify:CR=1 FL=1